MRSQLFFAIVTAISLSTGCAKLSQDLRGDRKTSSPQEDVDLNFADQGATTTGYACGAPVGSVSNQIGAAQLQACINAAAVNPLKTLLLEPGATYWLDGPVFITTPLTITTRGLEGSQSAACVDNFGKITVQTRGDRCATWKVAYWNVLTGGAEFHNQKIASVVAKPVSGNDLIHDFDQNHFLQNVILHDFIVDGSQAERSANAATLKTQFPDHEGRTCDNINCSNILFLNCKNCQLFHMASVDGGPTSVDPYANVFLNSPDLVLLDNLFWNRSVTATGNWINQVEFKSVSSLEGLTFPAETEPFRIIAAGNHILDSANGAFVFGTDPGRSIVGEIHYNTIQQVHYHDPGLGLALYGRGNFGLGNNPDNRKTLWVHHNTIDCDAANRGWHGCAYGIGLGVGPYYEIAKIDPTVWQIGGGRITDNIIRSAQVGLNVDGAGTQPMPVWIMNNRVSVSSGLSFNRPATSRAANDFVSNNSVTRDGDWNVQTGDVWRFDSNGGANLPAPANWSRLNTSSPNTNCAFGDSNACPGFPPENAAAPSSPTPSSPTPSPPTPGPTITPGPSTQLGLRVTKVSKTSAAFSVTRSDGNSRATINLSVAPVGGGAPVVRQVLFLRGQNAKDIAVSPLKRGTNYRATIYGPSGSSSVDLKTL